MAPELTWSRLVPGIAAIVVIIIATVALLVFGSVGRISGDKMRLYVVTNSARGVMQGTEVWLSGQKVGVVEDVGFRPPHTDTLARVVIAMDVRAADAEQIRHDSDVRVRAGANLVGPIVVYVTAGTPASPAVRSGDTLFVAAQSDVQDAMRRLGEVSKEFGPLMSDARAVIAHAKNPNGTIGAFTRNGIGDIKQLWSEIGSLRASLDNTAQSRAAFMAGARHALAQVDSIRLLLRDERSSLGRFRRDSTLGRTLAAVREDVATMRERFAKNPGTLGRFAADSAIQRALSSADSELALLIEDVRKRPLRYIAF